MPTKESGLCVDVPDHCRAVKADYWNEPGKETRREIKEFIKLTGRPYLWPGHTHTKPPPGSSPKYLDEFELPERFAKTGRLSPCPCCWQNHAKFSKGKIAWFPDEGVIRLIGSDCFRALDKAGHDAAVAEMRRRKDHECQIAFLLGGEQRLKAAYQVCVAAHPVAQAIESFSKSLRRTFEQRLNLPIWQYVRQGDLPVYEEFGDLRRDGTVVRLTGSKTYAPLLGHVLLRPDQKAYATQLRQATDALQIVVEHDDWAGFINGCSDDERRRLSKMISSAVNKGRGLLTELKELQRFVSVLNVATMRTWGQHPGNPMPIAFDRDGMVLRIGRSEFARMSVVIPEALEDDIGEITVPPVREFAALP